MAFLVLGIRRGFATSPRHYLIDPINCSSPGLRHHQKRARAASPMDARPWKTTEPGTMRATAVPTCGLAPSLDRLLHSCKPFQWVRPQPRLGRRHRESRGRRQSQSSAGARVWWAAETPDPGECVGGRTAARNRRVPVTPSQRWPACAPGPRPVGWCRHHNP